MVSKKLERRMMTCWKPFNQKRALLQSDPIRRRYELAVLYLLLVKRAWTLRQEK